MRVTVINKPQTAAVIGAGIAGAACAHALRLAGLSVHVFDKSRGPGGRLATRRADWVDRHGLAHTARLDHGAVGFTARSAAFQAVVDQAVGAGILTPWHPVPHAGSLPLNCGGVLHVPVPDMPALCRGLLDGAQTTWSVAVDSLHKGPLGWQVHAGGEVVHAPFDAVVLAVPPAQAAPLLSPHRLDWARHASVVPMQPCWTLMGVAEAPPDEAGTAPDWDLARPPTGPLACVLRSDRRPGRPRVDGQAHWVAHARPGFSRRHLEQAPAWVLQQMQAAIDEWLGRPVVWQHCVVHRWRYALPPAQVHAAASADPCWWDVAQALGVCGDFLGGAGVEGAWLSGLALSSALLHSPGAALTPRAATPDEIVPRLVA